jgi:hypothetical protein
MITFIPATSNDIPFLIKGFHETHAGIDHADVVTYEERLRSDGFSSQPKFSVLLFLQENQKIGYVVYAPSYFMSTGAVMWISQIYIHPEYRGRYFREVTSLLKQHAVQQNMVRLVWCSESGNNRLDRLWTIGGAKRLNENFIFWATKTVV